MHARAVLQFLYPPCCLLLWHLHRLLICLCLQNSPAFNHHTTKVIFLQISFDVCTRHSNNIQELPRTGQDMSHHLHHLQGCQGPTSGWQARKVRLKPQFSSNGESSRGRAPVSQSWYEPGKCSCSVDRAHRHSKDRSHDFTVAKSGSELSWMEKAHWFLRNKTISKQITGAVQWDLRTGPCSRQEKGLT